jgi:DNA-binding NarL/FixJ family response regulator
VTEGAGKPIRIVIVDDHTLFREGVRLILEPEPDLAVVGEAATVGQALPLIHGTRPDLVLLDLRLAQARGIDLLSQLVASPGAPRVLIVTAYPEEADIAEAVRLGAKGVVLKDATRETLLAAIRSVVGGNLWLPPELTAKVIAALTHSAPSSLAERVGLLTTRERQIVSLVGQDPVLPVLRGDHAHCGYPLGHLGLVGGHRVQPGHVWAPALRRASDPAGYEQRSDAALLLPDCRHPRRVPGRVPAAP